MKIKELNFLDEKEAFDVYLAIRTANFFNKGKGKREFKLFEINKFIFQNLRPLLNEYYSLKSERIKEYEFLNFLLKKNLNEFFDFYFSSDLTIGEKGENLEKILEKTDKKIYFKKEVKELMEKISYKEELKNLISFIVYLGFKIEIKKKFIEKLSDIVKKKNELKGVNLQLLEKFKEEFKKELIKKVQSHNVEINNTLLELYLYELSENLSFPYKIDLDLQAYYFEKEPEEGFVSFNELMKI